jgi:hypothetical protein
MSPIIALIWASELGVRSSHRPKFDESKLEERPAGSFFTEPKGVRHFGMTKDEGVVLYFVGTGPSTTDNLEK